jgi:hypothetical protein
VGAALTHRWEPLWYSSTSKNPHRPAGAS